MRFVFNIQITLYFIKLLSGVIIWFGTNLAITATGYVFNNPYQCESKQKIKPTTDMLAVKAELVLPTYKSVV